MARIDAAVVVSDAGPLIHLDELQCLDLLAGLEPLLVPSVVWSEVRRHRPLLANIPSISIVDPRSKPSIKLQALADSLLLGPGEFAALNLVEERAARILLCDDATARLAAESLGYRVHGTVGVILRAVRLHKRSHADALGILRSLPVKSTLHIASRLLQATISELEQSATATTTSSAGTLTCEHLAPIEQYILAQDVTVHYVGSPWSRYCRTWVYFANAILDADALRARFNLPAFVVTHVHRGTHDGAEQGIVCEHCHDALMGGHPELSPGARVIR